MEVSEESIANSLGGPIVSGRFVDESTHLDVVGDEEEGSQEYLSSTPVKSASGDENVAGSLKFPSASPLKRSTGMAFVISEQNELLCEIAESGKRRKESNDCDGSKMVTSTGGLSTEIGLSEVDDIVGQGPPTNLVNVLLFVGASERYELSPREKTVGNADIC